MMVDVLHTLSLANKSHKKTKFKKWGNGNFSLTFVIKFMTVLCGRMRQAFALDISIYSSN